MKQTNIMPEKVNRIISIFSSDFILFPFISADKARKSQCKYVKTTMREHQIRADFVFEKKMEENRLSISA